MNVYTAEFSGHSLPGMAAVVAPDVETAVILLRQALVDIGLKQKVFPEQLTLLPTDQPSSVVLWDGDY